MIVRRIARPLLAGMFITGGYNAARTPGLRAKKVEQSGLAAKLPSQLPSDPETLVRINGAVMVAGGSLLALGKLPRLSSLLLLGSLVPTTAVGHAFWNEDDPATKAQQQVHFFKNLSILGGLMLAAVDTEGRESVGQKVKRRGHDAKLVAEAAVAPVGAAVGAVGHAAGAVGHAAGTVGHAAGAAKGSLASAAGSTKGSLASAKGSLASVASRDGVDAARGGLASVASSVLDSAGNALGSVAEKTAR